MAKDQEISVKISDGAVSNVTSTSSTDSASITTSQQTSEVTTSTLPVSAQFQVAAGIQGPTGPAGPRGPAGPIDGTGEAYYLGIWTGSSAITTGTLVFTSGNRLGVNVTSPQYTLHIGGNVSGDSAYFSSVYVTGADGALQQIGGVRNTITGQLLQGGRVTGTIGEFSKLFTTGINGNRFQIGGYQPSISGGTIQGGVITGQTL